MVNAPTGPFGGRQDIAFDCGVELLGTPIPTQLYRLYHFTANGVNSRIRVSGATIATGDAGTNAMNGDYDIGKGWGNAFVLGGQIGEILMYNELFTDAKVANIESYIFRKWGLL